MTFFFPVLLYIIVFHGIIEWFGLEGTFKGHLVQPPCNERGHLQPDKVAQSPVQLVLEHFHGGGIYTSLGNLFQYFSTLVLKKFLCIS